MLQVKVAVVVTLALTASRKKCNQIAIEFSRRERAEPVAGEFEFGKGEGRGWARFGERSRSNPWHDGLAVPGIAENHAKSIEFNC
jgi:hypothetical protein